MFNYIIGFSVYTLAMMGIIFIAFVVVKKCSIVRKGAKSHNNFLEVETTLVLEPRKMVYVLRAGAEKILIATDSDKTTFLTKLNENITQNNVVPIKKYQNIKEESEYLYQKPTQSHQVDILEYPQKMAINQNITIEKSPNTQVFKDLLKRLQN